MLSSLSYVSRALIGPDDPELLSLVAKASVKNASLDITGALYFDGTVFFQVLEGPCAALETLFATIRADKRHENVRLLSFSPLDWRRFGGWGLKLALPLRQGEVRQHRAIF